MHATVYSRTTKITVLCIGLLVGVGGSYFIAPSNMLIATLIVAGIISLFIKTKLASIIIIGLVLGLARGAAFSKQLQPLHDIIGKNVTITARVDTPSSYNDKKALEFDVTHVKLQQPYAADLPIKMQISGYGANTILRGDTISATGKIYKKRGSKQAGISFAQLQVVQHDNSALQYVRRSFLAGMTTAMPEPHSQFAIGLLIGQKSGLPDYVVQTLQIVGLSHIIAVSGYNLTILADVSKRQLGKGSKLRGTLLSGSLVILFVAMVGSSASIQRAAFVSILAIMAAHYGRSIKPMLLISLAAAVTTILNPLSVWSDVGWYLSFLAFFGVLVIAPIVQKRLYGVKEPSLLIKLCIETCSAQIMTLPIMLLLFSQLSVVSLVANILVVPLVPLAMLASFVAGLVGMVAPFVAPIVGLPAVWLLTYMLDISSLLSRIPHANVQTSMSLPITLAVYASIVALLLVMQRTVRGKMKVTNRDNYVGTQ